MEDVRRWILRANALYLLTGSLGGLLLMEVPGIFFSQGPLAGILASARRHRLHRAHGLAFIIAILLWRALPSRSWHLSAAGVHVLLGTANLAFWQIFVVGEVLAMGYITTALHWLS